MLVVFLFTFITGLVVGSFCGVLIERLPNNQNPFKGRSHCDFCKKKLAWFDLVPVLSFVQLRGKCRYCRKKLSLQYPLIELVTGLLFVFVGWYVFQPGVFQLMASFWSPDKIGTIESIKDAIASLQHGEKIMSIQLILELLSLLIVFSSFLVIFVADLKYQIIPDELVLSSGMGALLYQLTMYAGNLPQLGYVLLAGLGACLFFYLIYFVTKGKGIGFGDVKLVFVLGLFLGVTGVIVGLYVAFLTGAAVSSILVLSHRKKWKTRIAFAPFLLVGAVTSFFFGQQFIYWYAAFFS